MRNASGSPEQLSLGTWSSILSNVRDIIGEDSSFAMFHYAALEEGRRLGEAGKPPELGTILEWLAPLLGPDTKVLEDRLDVVRIETHDAPMGTDRRPLHAVALGLLEGLISSSRNRDYQGAVRKPNGSDTLILELRDQHPKNPPGDAQ